MKLRLLILGLCLALCVPAFAQSEVDVTKLVADTKTFIFSNNKNTVKTYIYEELEGKTTCCGNDRIYLEVKIDPSGYVLQAKTLTGKNECYKKSAIDIVKNIKWDAKGFKGPKSVYFEIKPEVECDADKGNTYAALELFNNEVLDENGVPLSYASSTGVSASQASGTSSTPTGVPATPINPGSSRPAASTAGNTAGNTSGSTGSGVGEDVAANNTQPAATPAGSDDAGQASSGVGSDDAGAGQIASSANPSKADAEMGKAQKMAEMERAKQDDEINRLKEELAEMKKAEEDRAERDAEKKRREEAARERERIQEQQAAREERERKEREARREREREKQVASNDRNDGGFRDVDYGDDGGDDRGSRGGYDYSDNRNSRGSRSEETDPPRRMSRSEQAAEDKARLERDLQDLRRKMQDSERETQNAQRERERFMRDIARMEEQILRKDEEARKEREKEELDKLEEERRSADQRKREKEQEVQRMMDDLKRMQLDLDRRLADLKRVEDELQRKEEEKVQREQEITFEQQRRQQEIEAEIERKKLMAGTAGSATRSVVGGGISTPVSYANIPGDSLGIGMLAAQIEQLRQDILNLTAQVNAGGGSTVVAQATPQTTRGTATTVKNTRSGPGQAKWAHQDNSWKKLDYKDPKTPEDNYSYSGPVTPGVPGDKRPDPSHADTHKNVPGPKLNSPQYQGGNDAMKSHIAQKLKDAGICGLAQAAFEVSVDGNGAVVSHRILQVNSPQVQANLIGILQSMKFVPSGSRYRQSLITEFKADIICEGQERINIQDVPNIIRN